MDLCWKSSLELPCDVVLWSKDGGSIFTGHYKYLENRKEREGGIIIHTFQENSPSCSLLSQMWVHRCESGVLDMCWSDDILVSGHSDGAINFFKRTKSSLDNEVEKGALTIVSSTKTVDGSMCLYLSPDPENQKVWYSTSDGSVGLTKFNTSTMKNETISFYPNIHKYQAWCVCSHRIDKSNKNLAISGGDDSQIFIFDSSDKNPIGSIREYFNSGIACISSIPWNNDLFAVGCFDDSLTIWDIRKFESGPISAFKKLESTCWRLKWQPFKESFQETNLLSVALMHSNASVFKLDYNCQKMDLLAKNNLHNSLVYGVDWNPVKHDRLASCSFYDHVVHIWDLSPEKGGFD